MGSERGEGEAESTRTGASPTRPPPEAGAADAGRPLHPRSFKLRFASQREQGRSYVSLVRPHGLPATVTGKFYCREQPTKVDEEGTQRALRRIQDMFERGPREKYDAPVTSSQVYGWYCEGSDAAVVRADRRLNHHIRDSAWLRARLLVLAADDKLKQR
ncbi:uncharacterized protein LOC142973235 [Anticarsia gemmatalis]|uniref:uncharacterized protein LOC142973235 n=1 Tax=Anticarsia gemmatalis TaxID=129554 RepID=UPI003F763F81